MRQSGAPKFFNTEKAFGFIAPAVGPSDIFMRVSVVEGPGLATLSDGAKVSFETGR